MDWSTVIITLLLGSGATCVVSGVTGMMNHLDTKELIYAVLITGTGIAAISLAAGLLVG